MLIKLSNIITTTNTTMILMLFLTTFFSQKKMKSFTHQKKDSSFGTFHNTTFSLMNKNKTFFMSILKNLAILSLLPLLSKILIESPDTTMILTNWLTKNTFSFTLEFHFDLKFKMFLSIALFVSWSIMEFSLYYMNSDPNPNNFFRLLMIFLLKMIMLTSSNNIFLLFMGWEGVGFLSFLLMSWWTTRTKTKNSALQAMIYNRMGDIGILLFFSLTVTSFKSWSLSEISISLTKKSYAFNLLLMGALLAATGKSAQFGLHPWLPAAMEGPTPVSALLHSSTMVVAGIFLLIRMSPLYQKTPYFKTWCLILGSITATFAATTAMSQHDMKKMIAYSTTSQLGLMMISMGLNQPNIALFHICTHAFFKAMLFLSSGSIIHSLKKEQDMRKMGGLQLILPKTAACILLGTLALSGMPFLAGFYSKDLILELGLTNLSNLFGIILSFLATLLTSVYSLRIIFFCFMKNPSFLPMSPTKEEKPNLTKSLNRLALGTIISGWLMSTFMLFNQPPTIMMFLKKLAFTITLLSILFSISFLYELSTQFLPLTTKTLNTFTTKQWFYENLLHISTLLTTFFSSLFLSTRKLDRGWSENLGAQGMGHLSIKTSQTYQLTQTGYIKQYLVFSFTTFSSMLMVTLLLTY